jgi:hypothetical protein
VSGRRRRIWVVWDRFSSAYNRSFHRQWPDNPGGIGEVVDIVSAAVLDMRAVAFRTADKSEIFTEFLEQPFEEEDGTSVTRTPKQAEAALAFLVEQAMVVVKDELISIHPRFADVLNPPSAQADANESPVSTEWPVLRWLWGAC